MEIQADSQTIAALLGQIGQKLPEMGDISLIWADGRLAVTKNGELWRDFPAPVRAGSLLAYLAREQDRPAADNLPETLPIGPYIFYPRRALLTRAGAEDIILTDKERDLLAVLYQAPNRALTRQNLLDLVWAYADGVETHTLETHIYRLRRKIEDNPAAPQWLVNIDGEYKLNI